jgi:hypothetical protein
VHFEDRYEAIAWRAIKCHKSQLTENEMDEWINLDKKDTSNTFYFRRFSVKKGMQKGF